MMAVFPSSTLLSESEKLYNEKLCAQIVIGPFASTLAAHGASIVGGLDVSEVFVTTEI